MAETDLARTDREHRTDDRAPGQGTGKQTAQLPVARLLANPRRIRRA